MGILAALDAAIILLGFVVLPAIDRWRRRIRP